MTSFAAVSRVRRLARVQRAGHAGTLDPLADGVLLVLAGQATRIATYLEALPKRYRAVVRLGLATDTFDITGKVVAERAVPPLDQATVRRALARFTGPIMQTPPMYSALKRDGQPLYKLARQGIEVERAPRAVTVYSLELEDIAPTSIMVDVRCSKGTYIRALAHDIGAALGCGGTVEQLTRLAIGEFAIEQALDLGTATADQLQRQALSIDRALGFLPSVDLDGDQARAVRHGNAFGTAVPLTAGSPLRLIHGGRLLAIGSLRDRAMVQPDAVFAQEQPC